MNNHSSSEVHIDSKYNIIKVEDNTGEVTKEVYWCEEHLVVGYEYHCDGSKSIGFVTFIDKGEEDVSK